MKRIRMFLICCILCCVLIIPAYAENNSEVIDMDKECMITIDLDDYRAKDAKLLVWKVGDVDRTSTSLAFVLTKDFEKTKVDLSVLETGTTMVKESVTQVLADAAKSEKAGKPLLEVTCDKKGVAQIVVKPGMYLIVHIPTEAMSVQSMLVSVPNVSEDNSGWIYEKTLEPKSVFYVPGNPQTGDEENAYKLMQYGGMLLVALAVLIITIMVRVMNRKKDAEQ